MRIVVTGGSGLVGRHVVRWLSQNHDVVNVDLRAPRPSLGQHVRADVLDAREMRRAIAGADAVVHAAAIPGPRFGTEEEIERVNVGGTRTVAQAALDQRVKRFVFLSSESVLGFVFSGGHVTPRYFPIDEAHPLSPSEPYGRSKLSAEAFLARRVAPAMTVVSLRPPWVWVPEEYESYRNLTVSPDKWWDGLWAYVHGDDLARAIESAALTDLPPGHHAFYVTAADNGTVIASRDLIREYYTAVPIRGEIAEFGSLISPRAAAEALGYEPRESWRDFLSEA